MSETSKEDLQYKNLHLLQNKQGYRSSEDSLILLYTLTRKLGFDFRGNAFEFGTGSGIITLLLATKIAKISVTAIEVQESLFQLAKENFINAGIQNRVILIKMDGRDVPEHIRPQTFDCAFSNPPFYKKGSGKKSPSTEKQNARHEELCTMNDVIKAFSHVLKTNGRGFLIYPTTRLSELLKNVSESKTLSIKKFSFYTNLKNPVGIWKASQKKRDMHKLNKESKLFVAELKKIS